MAKKKVYSHYEARSNLSDMLSDEPISNDIDEESATKHIAKSTDAVNSVSTYNKLRRSHSRDKKYKKIYGGKSTDELLYIYHYGRKDTQTRKWLKDEIFFRTYFLMPYAIKTSYNISNHTFNDAMQNMSSTILQAIELFDPKKKYSFVNYLAGYFKGAIAKTFRDTNVVSVPTGKRKQIREARQRQKKGVPGEILSYTGIEYTESDGYRASVFDFEEDLHNKELVEWLEEALSKETAVVTPDERRILVLHYGLFGHEPVPYRIISKIRASEGKGSAYSRLSQIHTKALQKLQEYFAGNGIDAF